MIHVLRYKKLIAVACVIVASIIVYSVRIAHAEPSTYFFCSSVNNDPSELGNYFVQDGCWDPALQLPDFEVDIVNITSGAVFDGNARFNESAYNDGTVTGNAAFYGTSTHRPDAVVQGNVEFYDSSTSEGTINGDATFYGDVSDFTGRETRVLGSISRRYIEPMATIRDFTQFGPWTVVADGAEVDITNATFDDDTVFSEVNGGNFIFPIGATFYFNNASSTSPSDPGNYWLDDAATIPAGEVPNFSYDEVHILMGQGFTPVTFAGDAVFNGNATNKGIVTGTATFNDASSNVNTPVIVTNGVVEGDAFFYDSSSNQGLVEGSATFYNDLAESNNGTVGGLRTRSYDEPTVSTRNFTGDWRVIANGVVVDLMGATLDSSTILQTLNGGSFILPAPVFSSASVTGKEVELVYNMILDDVSVPDPSDFSVSVNGIEVAVNSVDIVVPSTMVDRRGVSLGLENLISNHDVVTVSYAPGTNPIQNENGVDAAALDAESVTVSTSIDLGSGISRTLPYGNKIYALSGNSAVVIDAQDWSVLSTISVGSGPTYLTAVNGRVYVLNQSAATISVIDPSTDTVSATIAGLGTGPQNLIAAGSNLYVPNSVSDTVSVVSTQTNSVTATISVGDNPRHLAVWGNYLYVTNLTGNSVSVVDLLTNTVVSTISVGTQPRYPVVRGNRLYVVNTNSVSVINTETNTVAASIALAGNLQTASVSGDKLYVVNFTNNNVGIISTLTNTVVGTVAVGSGPTFSYVQGTRLFVSNQTAGGVTVIDTLTDTAVDTELSGLSPQFVSAIGPRLYFSRPNDGDLTYLDTDKTPSLLPALISFTSSSAEGNYGVTQSLNITANFSHELAAGSTMTVSLNTGATVTLDTVSGNSLSGTYVIGNGEQTPDIAVTAITSASVTDTFANSRSSYELPASLDIVSSEGISSVRNIGDSKNISVGIFGSTAVGDQPTQMASFRDRDGVRYLYVTNRGSDSVSVVRASDGRVVDTVSVGDEPSGALSVTIGEESYVYVANRASDSVSIIDTEDNEVAATISVGDKPGYILEAGDAIYVSNEGSNTVSVIDPEHRTVTATVSVGVRPRGLAIDGALLYVANAGNPNQSGGNYISVIDIDSNTVTDALILPAGSMSPDGMIVQSGKLFVANSGSDTVSIIDLDSETIETLAVAGEPRMVAAVGNMVFVSAAAAGTIWTIDSLTGQERAITVAGNRPLGMAGFDSSLYYARSNDDLVSVLNLASNSVNRTTAAVTSGSRASSGSARQAATPPPSVPPQPPVPPTGRPDPEPAIEIDIELTDRLKGRLLLSVEDHGKIWYVDAVSGRRYEISIANALLVFRKLALGISNANLTLIPEAGTSQSATALGERLKGRFLLQVEERGEVWYVDFEGYRHRLTLATLIEVFGKLALGISLENLNKIPLGTVN